VTLLNKQNILDAADIQYKTITVPEWGGDVRLRSMTGFDRDAYENWLMEQPELESGRRRVENVRARMAAMSIVDDAGECIFTEADIPALGKKSAAGLGRIYDAITSLNAIDQKDVEALAKN